MGKRYLFADASRFKSGPSARMKDDDDDDDDDDDEEELEETNGGRGEVCSLTREAVLVQQISELQALRATEVESHSRLQHEIESLRRELSAALQSKAAAEAQAAAERTSAAEAAAVAAAHAAAAPGAPAPPSIHDCTGDYVELLKKYSDLEQKMTCHEQAALEAIEQKSSELQT